MNIKRILTTLIGLPAVIAIFVLGNKYLIDILIAVIACFALTEYFKCMSKEAKSISWIGYVLAIGIAFIHVLNIQTILILLAIGIPSILLLLFLHIIITDMKITFKDIAFSFIGIMYVIFFIMFIPLIYGMGNPYEITLTTDAGIANTFSGNVLNGKYLIWYLLTTAWGSDILAYCVGKHFGKYKFSKVSPNKTIEGCIAGVVGAVILSLGYTCLLNNIVDYNISYITIGIISAVLCVIGQIGDFAASTIKRYFDVKDFSEIFPGHGGMIDRIDSVMFIAPFAFCIFSFLL